MKVKNFSIINIFYSFNLLTKNIIRNKFIELLKGVSITLTENKNPFVLIAIFYFIFTCVILFSLINISIYLVSIYLINNSKYIEKLTIIYPFVSKLIRYFNGTRLSFIVNSNGLL